MRFVFYEDAMGDEVIAEAGHGEQLTPEQASALYLERILRQLRIMDAKIEQLAARLGRPFPGDPTDGSPDEG